METPRLEQYDNEVEPLDEIEARLVHAAHERNLLDPGFKGDALAEATAEIETSLDKLTQQPGTVAETLVLADLLKQDQPQSHSDAAFDITRLLQMVVPYGHLGYENAKKAARWYGYRQAYLEDYRQNLKNQSLSQSELPGDGINLKDEMEIAAGYQAGQAEAIYYLTAGDPLTVQLFERSERERIERSVNVLRDPWKISDTKLLLDLMDNEIIKDPFQLEWDFSLNALMNLVDEQVDGDGIEPKRFYKKVIERTLPGLDGKQLTCRLQLATTADSSHYMVELYDDMVLSEGNPAVQPELRFYIDETSEAVHTHAEKQGIKEGKDAFMDIKDVHSLLRVLAPGEDYEYDFDR